MTAVGLLALDARTMIEAFGPWLALAALPYVGIAYLARRSR